MSDSSLRLTCPAMHIIKPQRCVRGDGKLQSRKVPNIIKLFLFVRKMAIKGYSESQVWAACGRLALCGRREGSGPGLKPSSPLLWTAKHPLPEDLQRAPASSGSAEKQGLVLALLLPLHLPLVCLGPIQAASHTALNRSLLLDTLFLMH